MTNAKRDGNYVATILGTLDSDGATLVPILVNPSTKGLKVRDAATGSDNGPENAPRDENYVPALVAVSSADGVTPVVVYADVDGNLLIDHT
jgi:hypothetical protein